MPATDSPRIFSRDGRPLIRARDLVGLRRATLSDFYYFLIAARWRVVLAIYAGAYLLYLRGPSSPTPKNPRPVSLYNGKGATYPN